MTTQLNDLEKWVISEMIEKLEEMKTWNNECYMCDLAFTLFESENVNGSYYCSSYKAKQWIKENFDDLGETVENYQSEYGCPIANPFDESEAFQVQVVLYLASSLITTSKTVNDNWQDKVKLTDRILNKIIKELKEVSGIE